MDDGEAFRLVVKLGLHVDVAEDSVRVEYGLHTAGRCGMVVEQIGEDACAAARLAISRAAAEVEALNPRKKV